MTFFTRAAATALTGLAIFGFASAAFATPERMTPPEGSLDAHVVLARAIESRGVDFVVNHDLCQERPELMGFYSFDNRVLVVCNDNYKEGVDEDPVWTANDLDTLRHEAQHMIQDCVAGVLQDQRLHPVYKDPIGLVYNVLGPEAMQGINERYRKAGADTTTVILEWEAFAVAAMNVPLEQAQDIVRYCEPLQ